MSCVKKYDKIYKIIIYKRLFFMKKIFLILVFFFINTWILWADSWTSSVSWSVSSGFRECWTSYSHWKIHYWVPNSNTWKAPKSWSQWCTTHTYYSSTYTVPVRWWISPCWYWDRARWSIWSWKHISWIICQRYDDTPPSIWHISYLKNSWNMDFSSNWGFLMAGYHNINFQIHSPWTNNGAPINFIKSRVENVDNESSFDYKNHGGRNYSENFNFTKVDNFRNNNNFREYTYEVLDACDTAWNCLSHVSPLGKKIIFNVYSNYIQNKYIEEPNGDIADGKEKNFSFTLKDNFNNSIVPVKSLSWTQIRDLTFDVNYKNNLYLNQYTKTWESWMYVADFYSWTPWVYRALEIWNNKNINTKIDSINVKDWKYVLSFKPYSPTYKSSATDWRQYVDWNFNLISNTTVKLSDNANFDNLMYPRDLQYKPKFYTEIVDVNWGIIWKWLVVWTRQDSKINIKENLPWILKWDILLEYWYIDDTSSWDKHKAHKNFALTYNKDWWANWNKISSWKQNNDSTLTKFWNSSSNIFTNLYQTWKISKAEENTYFATHIRSDISGKDSVYSSFVFWMDRYNWTKKENNTYQRPLKIIWNTHSFYYSEVVEWDTWKNISLLWDLEKSELQKFVRQKVVWSMRNLSFSWLSDDIILDNLNFFWVNYWVISWDTMYFWLMNWKNLILDSIEDMKYNWVKNIVVHWWNVHIKKNILANNTKQDILSIISIKDEKENWWNIYIDPSVTRIESVIYADKSVTSYYNWKILSPSNWWTYDLLKNQLYVYWSIFSNNTIWGSINTDELGNIKPICPYYIKINCDIEESQKYDFYNMRRWYENIDQNTTEDIKYPLIIEYNPLLKQKNIKFFRIDNS